jgi:steroid delta-isomerase-like uncharacterized protein
MKNLLLVVSLAVLFCYAFACQNKAEKAELEKFRARVKVEEENRAIANRAWEASSKGDFEALKELGTPEYVWYLPSNSTKPISREEAIEKAKRLHGAFPDISFNIKELIPVGDKVICRYTMSGSQQGEFAGIPATGNKVEISGIMIGRIENGKIVEEREEMDMLGLFMQLGMELKPKEAEKK